MNSISAPDNIAPEKTTIDISNNTDYILPPLSFTVMRVYTNSQLIRLADCRADKGIFKYELESGGDISEYDIYTALYDNDGKLVMVWKMIKTAQQTLMWVQTMILRSWYGRKTA